MILYQKSGTVYKKRNLKTSKGIKVDTIFILDERISFKIQYHLDNNPHSWSLPELKQQLFFHLVHTMRHLMIKNKKNLCFCTRFLRFQLCQM